MFDIKTQEEIKNYVYLLIDPENDIPFYVGKGKNNRVFDHINQRIKEEDENLKYKEINRIGRNNVKHIVVRHGLSDSVAKIVEASLIDLFRYLPSCNDFLIGNIQGGYNSLEKGLMHTQEIKAIHNAESLNTIADDCVIININKNYKRGSDFDAIYNATNGIWKIASWRKSRYNYVLSEYKGLVREVFKVHEWYPRERHDKNGKPYLGYCFNGERADNKTRDKYIHKNIKNTKPRGYNNPVIFPETYNKWVECL